MGQVQALSRLLSLNVWDVGCKTRASTPRPEISTQTAEIGRKGRESHSRRPGISTQIAKIGRKG